MSKYYKADDVLAIFSDEERPFTEWVVGFMKKYGSEVSEDCNNKAND